jgi:hypothetical protein
MPRTNTFKAIEAISRTLPDSEVATSWGQPALTVNGRMFVCLASHTSAEPDTLAISASSHPLPDRRNYNDASPCPFFSPHNIWIYSRVSRHRGEARSLFSLCRHRS